MTLISKLYGFLSFNERDHKKLSVVRVCSGRPQQCTVLDPLSTDFESWWGEYKAKLIENKEVTVTLGDDISWESSVQVSKEFYRSGAFWA